MPTLNEFATIIRNPCRIDPGARMRLRLSGSGLDTVSASEITAKTIYEDASSANWTNGTIEAQDSGGSWLIYAADEPSNAFSSISDIEVIIDTGGPTVSHKEEVVDNGSA